MSSGVSVVICCFNSAERIVPTLQHLYDQKNIPLKLWEVVLVNNCSTDDTEEVARQVWNSFPAEKPNFKIIRELTPGLSAARRTGIDASFFDYVLFCDDDNWLNDDYLGLALEIMQSNPIIGVLGGLGIPIFEGKEPPYFWKNQFHGLAVGNQWHTDGDITEARGVVYGAGMVLNKRAFQFLLEKFNFEFQVSDRIGNSLMSSGDHELCLALKLVGYKIFYSKKIQFKHFIPKARTTISYYKNLFYSFGKSEAMLFIYTTSDNVNSIKNDYRYMCLRSIKTVIKIWLLLVLKGYYFSFNKYKYVGMLHYLYSNIGNIKVMLVLKNSHKKMVQNNLLFNLQSSRYK